MKVLLESTTQTVELSHETKSGGVSSVPARIWQGRTVTIDSAALRAELHEMIATLAREVSNMHPTTIEAHRSAIESAARRLAKLVAQLDDSNVEVHAFITRIAHKENERPEVFDLFARELQKHAPPRAEYVQAYPLRMFI